MSKITNFLVFIIRIYQRVFSPDRGIMRYFFNTSSHCVMNPSCSEYMIQAIIKYGPFIGLYKGIRRILRCHPFQKKLIDPV